MTLRARTSGEGRFLACMLVLAAAPLAAQEGAGQGGPGPGEGVEFRAISPEAEAVMGRMTSYLQGLQAYAVEAQVTRDEVMAFGYKLQNNERASLMVQRPGRLRAEVMGDVRDRTFVYDGSTLTMYSDNHRVFVEIPAPDTLAEFIGRLMDIGVEMPLIDMLYYGTAGTLADYVTGGVLVGQSFIDGVPVDHLAFRQSNIDWQLWVDQGDQPLPRKLLITTRYEVGDPQFQAVLSWDVEPKFTDATFSFTPPEGAVEIPFADATAGDDPAP